MNDHLFVPRAVAEAPPAPVGPQPAGPDHPGWKRLRDPFPANVIGKLPRVWCRECKKAPRGNACERHQMATCSVCRNRITTGHLHLDYVGHAAVTSRLLEVDPLWNWRPVTEDELADLKRVFGGSEGEVWIALTVLGHTRFGVGDASGGDDSNRSGGDVSKIQIGDALRNAAMRFGVALDLWAKEDLWADEVAKADKAEEVQRGLADGDEPEKPPSRDWAAAVKELQASIDFDDAEKLAAGLEALTKLASEAVETSEFKGAVKAAMASLRRRIEQRQKALKAKAAEVAPSEPPAAAE